jgi:hypothetical protein
MEHYLFEMDPGDRLEMKEQAMKTIPRPWEMVMKEVEERYQNASVRQRKKNKKTFPSRADKPKQLL